MKSMKIKEVKKLENGDLAVRFSGSKRFIIIKKDDVDFQAYAIWTIVR